MITFGVCVASLAALQVVLGAPQDFSSYFDTPANLRNFRPSSSISNIEQKPWMNSAPQISSRSSSWTTNNDADNSGNSAAWRNANDKWSTGIYKNNQHQLNSRTHMNDDAQPQFRQSSISSIPTISVPPFLPPLPDVTEQQLYGSVNVDALTAPYSLGDNTTENQTPIQLPDVFQIVNGAVNLFDHGFATSNKVQDVVSNHLINTFTNQTNRVQVNNWDLHRFYKLINATTNYITNVQRVNQSAILNQITHNNATEYQPYLYITQSQTNVVNDNGQAVQLPVIESSSVSSVALPPVFDTPVVTKFDYNGNPVPISPAAGKK